MKKFVISFLCVTSIIILCMISVFAESMYLEYDGDVHEYDGELYSLVVNNHEITPPLSPIIFNDRALVPVREIFEEVGAMVEYDTSDQSVTIYNDDTTVILYINNNIAYINGRKVAIPDNVVPKLISKLGGETKTMVPVRFISESIGMPVDFDAEAGAILIASDSSCDNSYSIPTEKVETVKPAVIDVIYNVVSDKEIKLSVFTDNAVESIADFTMDNPGRLVVDLNGTSLATTKSTININRNGITAVRLGDNGDRARIVVDCEYIIGYNVNVVSDNEIQVTINSKEPEISDEAVEIIPTKEPVATQKPQATVKPQATAAPTSTPRTEYKITNKLVVLDAGHGGTDSGAVGELDGEKILEKDLTLSITYKVKNILESNGIEVSMTRTGDTLPSLVERPTQANAEKAALFVSIHINSVNNAPEANGIETFYSVENNEECSDITSKMLADALLKNMILETGATNRGVKTANHAVTKRCLMPASLVECGFISNPEEVFKMTTEAYQNKIAEGIARGITDTLDKIVY